ncbi:glycosyltransferase [Escherichia coli]|uniref:glycosyltransferase n=1 Tax=Escherichia coli TaxID=562 RepID=UPI0040692D73
MKNCGAENVIDNWNKCLSYANGEYFILMGDDDKLDQDYLSEFNDIISSHPDMNVYHCRSLIINEKSIPTTLTQKNYLVMKALLRICGIVYMDSEINLYQILFIKNNF